MTQNKENLAVHLDENNAIELLNTIQEDVDYLLTPLSSESLLRKALKRIPWLPKFLNHFDDSKKITDAGKVLFKIGEQISNLPDLDEVPGVETASDLFRFGSMILSGLDFIRIPLIYLAAYILNEKVPITLNNNAKFLYSGMILALTITALVVPITAPIIAFIVAGAGLAVSIFLLTKTLYERYKLGKDKEALVLSLKQEEEQMNSIQQEAKVLSARLKTADEPQKANIFQEIAELEARYQEQKATILTLKNNQLHLEQTMNELSMTKIADRGVAVTLGALSVIGLVISLFFPPIGLALLIGVSSAAGIYIAARITIPLFKIIGGWIIDKMTSSKNTPEITEGEDAEYQPVNEQQNDSSLSEQAALSSDKPNEVIHNSTVDMLLGLGLEEHHATEVLHELQSHESMNDEEPEIAPVHPQLVVSQEEPKKELNESESTPAAPRISQQLAQAIRKERAQQEDDTTTSEHIENH